MLQTDKPVARDREPRPRDVGRARAGLAPATQRPPLVSIIIKALNEERRIALAIESALAALSGIDGEVILADGGSTDRTLEIAREYPIVIVGAALDGTPTQFAISAGR